MDGRSDASNDCTALKIRSRGFDSHRENALWRNYVINIINHVFNTCFMSKKWCNGLNSITSLEIWEKTFNVMIINDMLSKSFEHMDHMTSIIVSINRHVRHNAFFVTTQFNKDS